MAAAKKVLEHTSNVKFIVAGSGDQAERMIRMAAELGIGDRVLFTGFLRGRDISRVFSLADLYVMPSQPGIWPVGHSRDIQQETIKSLHFSKMDGRLW